MNKLLLLLLLFSFSAAYGQRADSVNFKLEQLPANVTNQWKFHAGDDAAWADTAFDDHSWQYIDATREYHFLPEVARAQIGWFRLTLNVSPALRKKTVAMIVRQYGAAEVYFNGVLIRTMGRVSTDEQNERTRSASPDPLTLQLTSASKQYIAIRYSFNSANLVIGYGQPVIRASFMQVDSAWDKFFLQVDFYTTRAWVSGGFMLLCILQLAIYLFNRERKVNLYLSLYALMQMITLADGLMTPIMRTGSWYNFDVAVFNVAAPLDFVFLMMMTYAFFSYKRGRWPMSIIALVLPVMVLQFMGDNADNELVLAIYNVIIYLSIIAISVKAIREKKAGAGLFMAGIGVSMIFFTLFNLNGRVLSQPFLAECFEVALAFITPAIILSILLAREFAQNIVSLRLRLAEVESLSARSLQQEQEKQQILADQNIVLEQQVTERTAELNQSLTNLKATQSQLIQSEKMASLGELTAGIAHEIQNPLNFVNNFSDVNREMLEELKAESAKPKAERDEQLEMELIDDLIDNEQKINHHGKRADSIVKGMLEHSRTGAGEKQPTDLNALSDEYLRLSYHGLRAKDKDFNADLVTNFDAGLPKANVVPQDISRVLLNLFNNAFYAVQQKTKAARTDYKPEVTVTTSSENGSVVIKVGDNGNGIPDAIKVKIMQPFFTTKPTGEGTGLGLSLSYDIVVKGHGGKIDVQSKEDEGSEFAITLPLN
ncbi:MAG TPA: ATP-binding protein [Mucilaginibacter sp.]|jgi:signal transduction histidine kinase|nr:ATP-binding protein [Mucilaginibacter sp.]